MTGAVPEHAAEGCMKRKGPCAIGARPFGVGGTPRGIWPPVHGAKGRNRSAERSIAYGVSIGQTRHSRGGKDGCQGSSGSSIFPSIVLAQARCPAFSPFGKRLGKVDTLPVTGQKTGRSFRGGLRSHRTGGQHLDGARAGSASGSKTTSPSSVTCGLSSSMKSWVIPGTLSMSSADLKSPLASR